MITGQTRQKMRDSHLGKPGFWTGKKRPDISLMRKGFRHTMETRKKIGDVQRGKKKKPMSEETKNKIAARLKGNKNCLGIKRSPETLLKFRMRMLGTHPSLETRQKYHKRMIGKKGSLSPAYIDGRTPENARVRTSLETREWRKACMERDHFTCQKTKIKGGYLVVHHIQNFYKYPELRHDIHNGITFSKKSHLLFHKIYGRKNNTLEQVLEFINS